MAPLSVQKRGSGMARTRPSRAAAAWGLGPQFGIAGHAAGDDEAAGAGLVPEGGNGLEEPGGDGLLEACGTGPAPGDPRRPAASRPSSPWMRSFTAVFRPEKLQPALPSRNLGGVKGAAARDAALPQVSTMGPPG